MHRKYYIPIVVFIAIFTLGAFLRMHNFQATPRHGATFDEFAWTWLGINLIQKGVPVSWSPHPQYEKRTHLIYQGAAFWIVEPYLEHPPLFGVVAGSFALLNGAKDMYEVTLANTRPLALFLGLFSVVMIFLVSRQLYGALVGIVTAALYATIPTIVIGSRIVQNENFLIPMWLGSLYLLVKYLRTGKKRFRNVAAIIAGLLSLAKVPWLVVGLSLSMILSFKEKWRDAFIVGGVTVAMFFLFIAYGVYFDKELFANLWALQIARYDISFAGFYAIFNDPLLVDRFYLDGWILFGWFSIFLLLRDLKKNFIVLIPLLAYLITFIFAIPNEPAHGWHRYPFYPFLIIAASVVLTDELRKVSLVSIFFVLFVGLRLLSNTWQSAFGFSYTVYRVYILSAVLPILYVLWRNTESKASYILVSFWLILFILLNSISVLSYTE